MRPPGGRRFINQKTAQEKCRAGDRAEDHDNKTDKKGSPVIVLNLLTLLPFQVTPGTYTKIPTSR